jgi:SpoVK/Ycf46/Vps4 family AAA+-type ATPase
LKAIKD